MGENLVHSKKCSNVEDTNTAKPSHLEITSALSNGRQSFW